jgi:hypothetical protein
MITSYLGACEQVPIELQQEKVRGIWRLTTLTFEYNDKVDKMLIKIDI